MGTTQFMAVPYALNAANISGLEALDEGNGVGWRLIGKDSGFYGDIGSNAVDLSFGGVTSEVHGATGQYATAFGANVEASGYASNAMGSWTNASGNQSTAIGYQTTASGEYATAFGNQTTASGS